MNEEVLKRLLTPLTDEEAKDIKLVTREELDEAIGRVDRALRGQPSGYYQIMAKK